MTPSEVIALVDEIIAILGKVLKVEPLPVSETARMFILDALEKYGPERVIPYVTAEVARLRSKPELHGLLAPSRLFAPETLADRMVVATADWSTPDPIATENERGGGSTRCGYLDDALPLLRQLLPRPEYEAVMRWDSSDRPESGWNRIRLRASVLDRNGRLITEEEARTNRPSPEAMRAILAGAPMTEEVHKELDAWTRWMTGRSLVLHAHDLRHENQLRHALPVITRAVRMTFAPEDRDLAPRVRVRSAPSEVPFSAGLHVAASAS